MNVFPPELGLNVENICKFIFIIYRNKINKSLDLFFMQSNVYEKECIRRICKFETNYSPKICKITNMNTERGSSFK